MPQKKNRKYLYISHRVFFSAPETLGTFLGIRNWEALRPFHSGGNEWGYGASRKCIFTKYRALSSAHLRIQGRKHNRHIPNFALLSAALVALRVGVSRFYGHAGYLLRRLKLKYPRRIRKTTHPGAI